MCLTSCCANTYQGRSGLDVTGCASAPPGAARQARINRRWARGWCMRRAPVRVSCRPCIVLHPGKVAAAPSSVRVAVEEQHADRPYDDLQVQTQGPVAQVLQIVFDARLHLIDGLGLAAQAVDL